MPKSILVGGVSAQSDLSLRLIERLTEARYRVLAVSRQQSSQQHLVVRFANHPGVSFRTGDLADEAFVTGLLAEHEADHGVFDAYIHNPAKLVLRPFLECSLDDFESCWEASLKSAVVVSQALLPAMTARGSGALLFTGATASVKSNANAAPFASAKFALRALALSLAKEFGPQGIHVAHLIVDGVIRGARAQEQFGMPIARCFTPDTIADTLLFLLRQPASGWSNEMDIRPAPEPF